MRVWENLLQEPVSFRHGKNPPDLTGCGENPRLVNHEALPTHLQQGRRGKPRAPAGPGRSRGWPGGAAGPRGRTQPLQHKNTQGFSDSAWGWLRKEFA